MSVGAGCAISPPLDGATGFSNQIFIFIILFKINGDL